MTPRSEIERVLDRYLAEGAEQVPDRVIDAALDQIDHIPQRRALRVPWRFHEMPTFLKPALAGVAVVLVLIAGSMVLNIGPTPSVGGPAVRTPSPTVAASPSASASPRASFALTDTSNWDAFSSQLYGYQIAHPPNWSATPATRDWSLEADRMDWVGDGIADQFRGSDGREVTLVTAFADEVPSGMSADEWIAAYYTAPDGAETPPPGCDPASQVNERTLVGGHPATLVINDSCGDAQTFVFREGRAHVFAVWRDRHVPLLKAFLSTVEFR